MLEIPGLGLLFGLNAVILSAGFLLAFWKRRIYSFIWAALLLFHLLSATQASILVGEFRPESLLRGQRLMLVGNGLLFLVLVGLDWLWLGSRTLSGPSLDDAQSRREINRYIKLLVVALLGAVVIRLRQGLGALDSDWEAVRSTTFSPWDALSDQLGFVFYPGIWLAVRVGRPVLAATLGLCGILFFQFSGSRAMLLVVACVVYLDLLRRRSSLFVRVGLLASLGIVALGVHTLARAIRGFGLSAFLAALLSGGLIDQFRQYYAVVDVDVSGGESGIHELYYYVVQSDYVKPPYRRWPTLRRLALLYLPRSLAPSVKPEDITYQIWRDNLADGFMDASPAIESLKAMARNDQDGCLPPTLWGDAYVNGGVTGVAVYPFLFGFLLVAVEAVVVMLSGVALYAVVPVIGVGYLMIARGAVIVGAGHIGYIVPIAVALLLIGRLPLWRAEQRPDTGAEVPRRAAGRIPRAELLRER